MGGGEGQGVRSLAWGVEELGSWEELGSREVLLLPRQDDGEDVGGRGVGRGKNWGLLHVGGDVLKEAGTVNVVQRGGKEGRHFVKIL